MICKFCGMDSATPDVCSWCGKSLTAPETKETPAGSASPQGEIGETPSETANLDSEGAGMSSLATTASVPAQPMHLMGGAPSPAAPPRKFAPAMPPPSSQGRPRTPAPGALPPTTRPAPPSAPPTGNASAGAANFSLNGEQTSNVMPETLIGSVPPAVSAPMGAPSLLEQADALTTPSLLSQSSQSSQDASERIPTRPLQAVASAQDGPQTAVGTGVGPGRPVNTPSVAPAAATAPTEAQRKAAVDAALLDSGPSPLNLLLRYLGVFVLILAVMGGIAFIAKSLYIVPMLIAMFVGALLLPVMRVSPWADEDSDDLVWFVLLTLLFGPLVAVIIYGTVAAIRQEFNASILGCLAVAALARIVGEAASSGTPILRQLFAITSPFTTFRHIDSNLVKVLLLDWSGFVALAGWYAASAFHKEDE